MPSKRSNRVKNSDSTDCITDYDDTNTTEPFTKKMKSSGDATIANGKWYSKPITKGNSIIKYQECLQRGQTIDRYRYSVKLSLINHIKTFRVSKAEGPFDRRITFIEWHPTDPNLLAVASKGGDIILWKYEDPIDAAYKIKGIGAGGSVQALKFDLEVPHKIYTVSIEGKLLYLNFKTKKAEQFLDTSDFTKWYTSLDINWGSKTMVVGDNRGELTILTTDGETTDRVQLHKKSSKITHVEFSKREPWLLCTTSTDYTLKVWDIRSLRKNKKGIATPLCSVEHSKPINAAYFSLTDGCRVLTTDQFDRVHIYRSPLWNLETEIHHPHRQFQHLTPIKAYWHPLEDIVIIGRYPHENFPGYTPGEPRTIDFFDAETGHLLHQHSELGFNRIASLNKFNVAGDALASGTGCRILIWKPRLSGADSAVNSKDGGGWKDDKPNPPDDNSRRPRGTKKGGKKNYATKVDF